MKRKRHFLIRTALALFMVLCSVWGWGQVIFTEDFDYPLGQHLTSNGWDVHSGSTTQPIDVTNGLTFPGYVGSGVGGAANLDNNGQDVNRTFSAQSGTFYVAFMLQTQATNSAGYFFHLSPNIGGGTFTTRLFVNGQGNGLGLADGSSFSGSYVPITAGQTYLVVIKRASDGTTDLHVFDSLPSSEPTSAAISYSGTTSDINAVALRQYNASQRQIVDGIRIATSWTDIFPAQSTPSFLTTPTSITGLNYGFGSGPSVAQNFTLEGANLDNSNVTITAPANFEISQSETTGYASSIILNAYDGTSQTVWVRLAAGLALGSYTGDVSISGGGVATALALSVSGDVLAQPSVTAASLNGTVGTAYTYQIIATENPDSYALASGSLPAGLNLDTSTGIISGTPTSAGTFTANITATNAAGTSAPAAIEITIGKGTQTVTLNDINTTVGASAISLPATTDAGLTITYGGGDPTVATVSGNTLTIVGVGNTTITATVAETGDYFAFNDDFTVTVNTAIIYTKISSLSELFDGEYVVVSNGTNAMNNTVSSNKLQTTMVTVNSNSIINPDDTIVWIIETDNANVKTLRNKASSTFVSGGGGNTNITLVQTVSGDGQKWEASIVNSLFRFTNQSQTNRALVYNGSVFGQYAISNVDGLNYFDLELYKKEPAPASTTYAGGSWSNGAPNSPDTDAVISENYNGAGFTAKDITVSSGASLTITSTETITAANITVEDNANFIQEDGSTLNLTGTMTLNKNATSDAATYVFWSSPVQNQNVYDMYPAGTPQFVMTYDSDTDLYPTVANPTMAAAGVGYSVKVPVSATAAQFIGAPNSGDVIVNLDHVANANGNTWNLIGNPYPSNLNLQSLYSGGLNGIDSSIYFWDNISATNTTQQQAATTWAVFNAAGGTWSSKGGLGIDDNSLVKPGQGFIVKATAPSTTFTNAMRSAATANFINKGMNPGEGKFWLKLATPAGTQFQTAVTYGGGALNTFEAFDSKVMSVGANGIYSYLGTDKLAIQGRDYFVNTDVVILGNKHSASGQYTFSLAGKTGLFDAGQAIYLKDKQTNIYTNLQTDSYTFLSDALEQQDRFEIVYQPQAALGTSETVKTETVVYKDGDHFTVKASEKILSIEVYDAAGRHIGTVKPDSTTAQVTAGSRGMYLLKIKTLNSETVKKVIK